MRVKDISNAGFIDLLPFFLKFKMNYEFTRYVNRLLKRLHCIHFVNYILTMKIIY